MSLLLGFRVRDAGVHSGRLISKRPPVVLEEEEEEEEELAAQEFRAQIPIFDMDSVWLFIT